MREKGRTPNRKLSCGVGEGAAKKEACVNYGNHNICAYFYQDPTTGKVVEVKELKSDLDVCLCSPPYAEVKSYIVSKTSGALEQTKEDLKDVQKIGIDVIDDLLGSLVKALKTIGILTLHYKIGDEELKGALHPDVPGIFDETVKSIKEGNNEEIMTITKNILSVIIGLKWKPGVHVKPEKE